MNTMTVHKVIQGSAEWLALRAQPHVFSASDAAAMMGECKFKTRNQLLAEKSTGLTPSIDPGTQRRFDEGHRTEAAFRAHAENFIGDELYPVTGSIELDGLTLLASFDGLTMGWEFGFEHKLLNQALLAAIAALDLGPAYYWQLEQQLLVSGAEKILFCCSDGTPENAATMWYESIPSRRAALIAGWKQFREDLAAYQHRETPAQAAGRAPESLPALRIEVTGMVTSSNLAEFKRAALDVFAGISTVLETDDDFASAEKTVKWCADVEDRLAAAKQHALSQTASIDELFRAIDDISAEARQKRLQLDKLVKARKESIRIEIVDEARQALAGHLAKLNARLGGHWMPLVDGRFADAVKGKRTISSLRDAADTALAHAKITANEIADRIELNRKAVTGDAHDWMFLFPDFKQVANADPEMFAAVIAQRIAHHESRLAAAEAQRRASEEARAALLAQANVVESAPEPVATAAAQPATVTPIRTAIPPADDIVEKFLAAREWKSAVARKNAGALLHEFVEFTRNRRATA